MASGNHLAFNISKASATTSTTNTTTTSVSGNVESVSASATRDALSASLNDPKLLFSHNLAPNAHGSVSPGIKPVTPTTSISGINSLTVTTLEQPESSKDGLELLDIWGKYDVNISDIPDESSPTDNMDLLEEKMDQFKIIPGQEQAEAGSPKLSSLEFDEKRSDDSPLKCLEPKAVTEGTLGIPGGPVNLVDIFDGNSEPLLPLETPNTQSEAKKDNSESVATFPAALLPESSAHESRDEQTLPSGMGIQAYMLPDESKPEEESFLEEVSSVTEYRPSSDPPASRPSTKRHNSLSRITPSVNPEEQHQQSHKPFDFQVFLSHLKNKSADPLVRYIQSFLVSFSRQSGTLTVPQMIKAVRNFKEFMNEKFLEYEPFASMDDVDLENSGEGVEKLIMNRLYDYCYSPEAIKKFGRNASVSVLDDVHQDYEFTMQLEKFSWILAVHLDIDLDTFSRKKRDAHNGTIDYIDYAVSELNKINKYRAPRDKIICILNACKIIFNLLESSKQETNADAFMPILIIVIIRAKTDNLISNIQYIERYRGEEWLNHGETSYYLSSMQAAISFLQKIGMEDLTIEESEYEANMEAWEAELRQRGPPIAQPEPIRANANTSVQESLSPSNVILAGAEMFTKSLSNFMSPSPLGQSTNVAESPQQLQVTDGQIEEATNQLAEIFPSLDRAVLLDVVIMKKGDFDSSLDVCLQLCSDN